MTETASFTGLLHPSIPAREVEPGILTVLPLGSANSYDDHGALAFYDAVACNPIYNRLMWGYRTAGLDRFCEILLSGGEGWFLDAGCGSLAFTAGAYARCSRPVVLADQSLTLLRKARQRLLAEGMTGENIVLLQADVMALPFRDEAFGTVMSMNMLHVLPEPEGMLAEVRRVLGPSGQAGFTTLHLSGRWSDRYLRMWERKGEVVCRTSEEVLAILAGAGMDAVLRAEGNMGFFQRRQGAE
ncbi:methyltransferase domain-containing protein [Pseudodesulfovibrio cashew]|uniref:Methyltransferase domain-containing protein n=1 Tax=Pseudodesulfovibrio cashew TaxID=2678688 RepID=A0A6I6JM83_9BACT|nr:class I SAM-dependent methyltransferase [Pseudodesulfovibrio cashew]QGY38804.1 methyltransferase domain-containing protein [Pseudodesulfovibrio cashew]